jgi:hypothetical protein
VGAFLYKFALLPSWVVLLPGCIFYAHLVFGRFRVSLGPFMALVLVWGHLTAFTWTLCGWEMGLTASLGFGMLLGFGMTWAFSVADCLGFRGGLARFALFILGAALPFGILIACGAIWLIVMGARVADWAFVTGSALILIAAGAVVAWAAWFSLRMWKRARDIVATSGSLPRAQ